MSILKKRDDESLHDPENVVLVFYFDFLQNPLPVLVEEKRFFIGFAL
jgi:hypothetical protein